MPKFNFFKRDVEEAKDADANEHGDGHVRLLVVKSDTPAEYQGRVASALIEGTWDAKNGTVVVTVDDN